ncbi:MAG: amidohydrolase [Burkholderiales bacterium]|jgi:aminocarboxymuconate-semialdehyde decarboxylase|nr:amidohydrolase [Burkholderiales bacterium]
MKRIDVHNHVIPETIVRAMQADPAYNTRIEGEGPDRVFIRGKVRFPFEAEFYDAEAKLESMDRKKIDIAFISPGPQCFFYNLRDELAIQTARIVNDGVAQMAAAKPDRLRGMATLPMQHPEAAIAELERVVKEYGFRGVELGTAIGEEELADPKFRPVLKRIEQLKVTVFAHPNTQGSAGRLDCYYLTNLIGNPLDTTIMVGKLMFSGALDELKDLRILLAHGGGFLPYQIGRFVHGHKVRPDTAAVTKSDPHAMLKRFWFDALTHSPQAIRHLIDVVGSEKVVLGTDAPFDMGEMAPVDRVEMTPGLTAKEREDIFCRAATALFDGKI